MKILRIFHFADGDIEVFACYDDNTVEIEDMFLIEGKLLSYNYTQDFEMLAQPDQRYTCIFTAEDVGSILSLETTFLDLNDVKPVFDTPIPTSVQIEEVVYLTDILFCFILLTHERSHREVY